MKNILFDLYGTLVDIHTEEGTNKFWEKFSRKTNKYKSFNPNKLQEEYLKTCAKLSKTREEIDILEVFELLFNVKKQDAYIIAQIFRKLSTEYIRLYPKVKKTLKLLISRGNKLYLLSNAQNAFTMPELKKLGIVKYFDGIAISSDYGIKKPNIEFFKKAIKNFNLQEEIWMIGNDYKCDIEPAKKLGLNTIFIESNLTPPGFNADKITGFDYKKILNILN